MDKNHIFDAANILGHIGEIGVDYKLYHHEPVFSVAEADKVAGLMVGAQTRNLFLRDKRETMFLVTLRHDTPVDLKKLADILNAGKFSFGSPERLWTYLGVKPGSVTPLSILNDVDKKVQLVLESGMMAEDIINVHPLDNSMTIGITPNGLMNILEQNNVTPMVLDLSCVAPDRENKICLA